LLLSANAILPSDRKTPPVIAAFLFDRGTANWLSRVDMNLEFNENAVEIPNLAKPLGFIQTKVSPCYVFTTTERIKQAPLYFKGILLETRTEIKHQFADQTEMPR
jgi:hypothetical protein